MPVTAAQRHQLFLWFEEHMGQELAPTMMELMPPAGADDLASRSDVHLLRSELRTEATALRTEMAELRSELRTDMAELRSELRTDMAELRTELRTDMAELRTELRSDMAEMKADLVRTLATLLVASHSALLVAVGVFTALA